MLLVASVVISSNSQKKAEYSPLTFRGLNSGLLHGEKVSIKYGFACET